MDENPLVVNMLTELVYKSTSRAGDFTTINKQAKIQEGP